MHSKNKKPMTADERAHVCRIKAMACAVCEQPGPSDAHEIEQGAWFISIPLCNDCHTGPVNGLHGQRAMWHVMHKTELSCLADTVRKLVTQ